MSGRGRRLAAIVAAVLAGGAAILAAHGAAAVPAGVQPGKLRLTTEAPGIGALLSPGDSRAWLLTAELEGAPRGRLSLVLHSAGDLTSRPDGLWLTLDECAEAWEDLGSCRPGATTVIRTAASSVKGEDAIPLGTIRAAAPRHLRLEFALPPDSPAELQDRAGVVGLGFIATGDALDGPDSGGLPAADEDPTPSLTPVAGPLRDAQAGCTIALGTDGAGSGGTDGPGARAAGDPDAAASAEIRQCPVLSLPQPAQYAGIPAGAYIVGTAALALGALGLLVATRRRGEPEDELGLEALDA